MTTSNQTGASYQWVKDSKWTNVGTADFSVSAADYTSIAIDTLGTPFIVFSDHSNARKATVMKYDGSNWVVVGNAGFSDDMAFFTSIAISNTNEVYVCFFDAGNFSRATVKRFDGTQWVNVGPAGFSPGSASGTRITIDNNQTPYVSYTDYYDTLRVMKYNGVDWVQVGSGAVSEGKTYIPSLQIGPDNTPYIAYSDNASLYKPVVKKFDGNNWTHVGTADFVNDQADDVSIAIDLNSNVFLSYSNKQDNFRTNVWKFNGTIWEQVGQPNFSALTSDYLSIAIDGSGTPFVAYQDGAYGQKLTVKKFDGNNWVDLGSYGFSPDLVYYSTMAISRDGIPHVAFSNYANSYKASVMKFDGTLVGENINFSATELGCYSLRVKTCMGAYSSNYLCVSLSDLELILLKTTKDDCSVSLNGNAIVKALGGELPYQYSWNSLPVQLNDTASGLAAGSYLATVVDANHCMATVEALVELEMADTSVSLSESTLTANSINATYQWISCDNGFAVLEGETGQSLTVTTEGNYAVIVTENGICKDTSACFSIIGVLIGAIQPKDSSVVVYPNPNNGNFIVVSNIEGIYNLVNELGIVVKKFTIYPNQNKLELTHLASGVYYLIGEKNRDVLGKKIVVVKN
jgi:hypothetical protein